MKGKVTREIIVRFEEFPISEHWINEDYYLIMVPDSSWIGRPNQSKDDYIVIFDKWLFQSESGAHFKIINTPEWAGIHQLIERSGFTNDTIRFNTFQEFEHFGKEIIISSKSPF